MEPITLGDRDPRVAQACLKLGVFPVSETFTEPLAHRVRGFQYINGLPQDGFLDEEVLSLLGIEGNYG